MEKFGMLRNVRFTQSTQTNEKVPAALSHRGGFTQHSRSHKATNAHRMNIPTSRSRRFTASRSRV